MKYHFKQAVRVGRQTFTLGAHEVPEEVQKHAAFKHFAKAGLIEAAQAPSEGKQKTLAPASSDIAKVSASAAKSQLEPDSEIGGEPTFEDKPKKGKR